MNEIQYGAVRENLLAGDYVPTSTTNPGGHGYKIADDAAAVMCIPQHGDSCGVPDAHQKNVVALTVTVRDAKIRAEIAVVLSKFGIGKGPVRLDSAGNETHVVRLDGYGLPMSQAANGEAEPAVALDSFYRENPTVLPESAIIRLDGTWRNDLLSVPRAKLPALDDDALKKLF